MATQTVRTNASSGLLGTVTMKLMTGDTVVASVTPTVGSNNPSLYTGVFTDVAAGRYEVVVFDDSTPVSSDFVTLTLTTDTFESEGRLSVVDRLDAIITVTPMGVR